MHKPSFPSTALLAAITAMGVLALTGCFGGEKEKRGLRYMPDMYESPALKSTETMTVIDYNDEGNVVRIREVPGLLPPPTGARARNLPYSAPMGAWESEEHAKNANPLVLNADTIRLGRIKYENYCAVCHGLDGNVDNNYLGDKFSAIPSLNNDLMAEKTDGHIYDVITHGIRRMPNYRAQLLPDERWAVTHYLRVLQGVTKLDEETTEALLNDERNGKFREFALPPKPVPEYEQGTWPELTK